LPASCREIQRSKLAMGLPEVGQHLGADARRLAGGLQGGGHVRTRARISGEFLQSQFQIHYYRGELVVEVVGYGPGHPTQAFGFLELPVLGLQFFPLRLGPLALGDIRDNADQPDEIAGLIFDRIGPFVSWKGPAALGHQFQLAGPGFAALDIGEHLPGNLRVFDHRRPPASGLQFFGGGVFKQFG